MRKKGGSNRVAPPRRKKNSEVRSREYLTEDEVDRLLGAARILGRHGDRDAAMIMIAYRHGLRAEELVELRWDQINMDQKLIHVTRVKNGMPGVHPLKRPELAALRKLIDRDAGVGRGLVFTTEKNGTKMSTRSFHTIVARAGIKAGLGFPAHPHMLRHGAGYKLANDRTDTRAIQGYLGHRNIQHTVRYTELAADRFKDVWKE